MSCYNAILWNLWYFNACCVVTFDTSWYLWLVHCSIVAWVLWGMWHVHRCICALAAFVVVALAVLLHLQSGHHGFQGFLMFAVCTLQCLCLGHVWWFDCAVDIVILDFWVKILVLMICIMSTVSKDWFCWGGALLVCWLIWVVASGIIVCALLVEWLRWHFIVLHHDFCVYVSLGRVGYCVHDH